MSQVTTDLQIDFSGWVFQPGAHFLFFLLWEEKNKHTSLSSHEMFCYIALFGDGNKELPKG